MERRRLYNEIPWAIGLINAQLKGIVSLFRNLRWELLAIDPSITPLALESGLVGLKDSVTYFRRSFEEVNRSTERLVDDSPEVLASERTT